MTGLKMCCILTICFLKAPSDFCAVMAVAGSPSPLRPSATFPYTQVPTFAACACPTVPSSFLSLSFTSLYWKGDLAIQYITCGILESNRNISEDLKAETVTHKNAGCLTLIRTWNIFLVIHMTEFCFAGALMGKDVWRPECVRLGATQCVCCSGRVKLRPLSPACV